jgi:RHS repeat-associated protein
MQRKKVCHLGQVTSIGLDPVGTTLAFDYDALGRLLKENHTSYGAKTFGYDLAGRRTHMAWKDGVRIDYTYLVTGEMKTIAENAAAVPGAVTLATFGYDDRGNRTKLTRGNGTVTDYSTDAVSRLQSMAQSFPASSTNNLQLGFAYNPAGQIVTNERSNNLYSWRGATVGTTASTPNALNQIASANGVGFSYDAKGNLTSNGTRSYSYDAENRLATAGTASFYYDPLGRLVWFTGSGGALFDYEGSRLVTEVDGITYAIRRRFVHGPGSDEPLVWYEGTGTGDRRWLHADERGSIVAITDAAGAMTARNRYDEYGLPASTNVGRFQYTGQKWLPQLALYDYKARTYDPRLGRFLQPDPIGYGDGMNRYGYVGGDPVNKVDPTGLFLRTPRLEGVDMGEEPDRSWDTRTRSYDGMGIYTQSGGSRLETQASEREQRDLRNAIGKLDAISAATGISGGCLLSESCASVHLAGQPTGGTAKIRAGALPWDPRHEAALYKPTQAEMAAVRATFGAVRDQLKTGHYSNRKIGMKPYHNNGPYAFLPPPVGTYHEARVFMSGVSGLRRIVVDSKNLGIVWYSPEHYRYFIPVFVVPAR